MKTILYELEPKEFDEIRSGAKNYIVMRSKAPITVGQKLLLQSDTDEMHTTVSHIGSGPGLMKDTYILSFDCTPQSGSAPIDMTSLNFDFGQTTCTDVKDDLAVLSPGPAIDFDNEPF